MRVNSLDGTLLDFWVAKSENLKLSPEAPETGQLHASGSGYWHPSTYHPSRDWSLAGEIISNEWYSIEDALIEWFGANWAHIKAIQESPLKWFMRAYVKTKFGDVVEEVEHIASSSIDHDKPKLHKIEKRRIRWFFRKPDLRALFKRKKYLGTLFRAN